MRRDYAGRSHRDSQILGVQDLQHVFNSVLLHAAHHMSHVVAHLPRGRLSSRKRQADTLCSEPLHRHPNDVFHGGDRVAVVSVARNLPLFGDSRQGD